MIDRVNEVRTRLLAPPVLTGGRGVTVQGNHVQLKQRVMRHGIEPQRGRTGDTGAAGAAGADGLGTGTTDLTFLDGFGNPQSITVVIP